MALPTPKEIKKLADACRKAGILHFKAEGVEFTLSQVQGPKPKKTQKVNDSSTISPDGEWDTLSEIDKLMWSSATLPEVSKETA